MGVIIFIVWVAFIFVAAAFANKKGRSYVGWLIVSLFFSPLVAIILLVCLGDTDERRRERIIEEDEIRKEINQY